MKIKIILSIALLICSGIVYNSCDTSVDSTISSVSGKIYNYSVIPSSNLKVTVQNQTVYTSSNGSFAFDNVIYPYDLIVTDSSFRSTVYIYKGLSVKNITIPLNRSQSSTDLAFVNVHLPAGFFQSDLECKIIFTDGNYINKYVQVSDLNQDVYFDVPLNGNNSVSGRLFVLTYKSDSENRILSYENFGQSPEIQLQSGSTFEYTFDSQSLSLNPGEQEIECTFNNISKNYLSSFYISFSPKYTFNETNFIFSELQGSSVNFKIPTGIPAEFKTFVNNYSYNIPGDAAEDFNVIPNVLNEFTVKVPPDLVSPDNEIQNVNNNTQFSFNTGTGNGIYEISLFNNVSFIEYKIITSNNNFTLEGLEELEFGNFNNNNFNWNVKKIGPANSMNDFITDFFNKQNHFFSQSTNRYFSTEP